jgi:hypothetical protein
MGGEAPLIDKRTREISWSGKDDHGNEVAPVVYFCRLEASGRTLMRRMVLLK